MTETFQSARYVHQSAVERVGRYNTVAVDLTDGNRLNLFLGSCIVLLPALEAANEDEATAFFQDVEGTSWHFVAKDGKAKLTRMKEKERGTFVMAQSYFLTTMAVDELHDAVQFVAVGGK